MPNIEIHGLDMGKADEVRDNIFGLLQGKPYAKNMVVEVYRTEVIDIVGKSQPYLRLLSSNETEAQEIIQILHTFLEIDIEWIILFRRARPAREKEKSDIR